MYAYMASFVMHRLFHATPIIILVTRVGRWVGGWEYQDRRPVEFLPSRRRRLIEDGQMSGQ